MTDSSGHQQQMEHLGTRAPYRLLCDKIPSQTGVQIIMAVVNTKPLESVLGGKNNGIQGLIGGKRMPSWIRLHATYKARMRPYTVDREIVPEEEK